MARVASESFVDVQVRLVLEQRCAEEFIRLVPVIRGRNEDLHFTLLMFDYGEANDGGNIAFKTTLSPTMLVAAWEELLRSWDKGVARPQPELAFGLNRPGALKQLADEIKARHPVGIGFAILFGHGSSTAYVAAAERSGIRELLEVTLLPNWRKDASS